MDGPPTGDDGRLMADDCESRLRLERPWDEGGMGGGEDIVVKICVGMCVAGSCGKSGYELGCGN